MAQLLAGYVLGPDVEMHTLQAGGTNKSKIIRTFLPAHVKPMLSIPLFILTSPVTASSAEVLAYDLKHLGRSKIVGEKTMGAGNCFETITFNFPQFTLDVQVPAFRPVHPVTHTNWQGIGVIPDFEVSAEDALSEAHKLAVQEIASQSKDKNISTSLLWASMELNPDYRNTKLSQKQLEEYAGTYGPRRIIIQGNDLVYERDGNPSPFKLVLLDKDTFRLEGIDIFRLRFDRNEDGVIIGLTGIYSDGNILNTPKDK